MRADGLTSLRILDGLRAGLLAAGIVRGPVADPDRVASAPLARVPVDHVAVPPGHRLAGADVVEAADLDGEPVLVVDRAEAPTAHDEIEAYCAAAGARPRWIPHAAIQVERVLDQVALGTRHRLAQLVAGRAGRPALRRRRAAAAPGGPVRRVPRRVAGRRHVGDDRGVRVDDARDLRDLTRQSPGSDRRIDRR